MNLVSWTGLEFFSPKQSMLQLILIHIIVTGHLIRKCLVPYKKHVSQKIASIQWLMIGGLATIKEERKIARELD